MGVETLARGEAVFIDTSLVVAATVEVHPSHKAAVKYVDEALAKGAELYLSAQVCREFLVVLTRQPVSGRTFTLAEALDALAVWTKGCTVVYESDAVLAECLSLVRTLGVHGKQVHDCNIFATMKVHGILRLATRNPSDFKRFGQLKLDAVD